MSDQAHTRVLIVDGGDEGEGFTPEISLEMDRSLWEDGSLTLSQRVDDDSSSALFEEPGLHLTVTSDVEDLGRSGVGVRGAQSTRSGWVTRLAVRKVENGVKNVFCKTYAI